MISLIQLQYAVAVDTYRHFAVAAEKCFITQPTLSMQLKKMEEELGVKVFDRSKQPVVPTDIGKRIIEQARNILSEYHKVDQIVADYTDTMSGNLRVGIIPTLASTLLPKFAGQFSEQYQDVKLAIIESQTEDLLKMLMQETLDVAIVVTPLGDSSLSEWPIAYEGIRVYANTSHPFASMDSVPIDALERPDIWLLSNGHCFRNQVINLCSYRNLEESEQRFSYTSGSLETLRRLVDTNGGFTLLPELYLADLENAHGVLKPLTGDMPLREISLVYTRHFVKEKLLKALYQSIQRIIPKSMQRKDEGYVVEWR